MRSYENTIINCMKLYTSQTFWMQLFNDQLPTYIIIILVIVICSLENHYE